VRVPNQLDLHGFNHEFGFGHCNQQVWVFFDFIQKLAAEELVEAVKGLDALLLQL
jgi:hypothetical protein